MSVQIGHIKRVLGTIKPGITSFKVRNGMDLAGAVEVLAPRGLSKGRERTLTAILKRAGFNSGIITVSRLDLNLLQGLVHTRMDDKDSLPAIEGRLGIQKEVLSNIDEGPYHVPSFDYIPPYLRGSILPIPDDRIPMLSTKELWDLSPLMIERSTPEQAKALLLHHAAVCKIEQFHAFSFDHFKSMNDDILAQIFRGLSDKRRAILLAKINPLKLQKLAEELDKPINELM